MPRPVIPPLSSPSPPGGTIPDADPAALNKAAVLRDGARVYVPRHGEIPPAGSVGSGSERKIDINQATTAELESLPRIGPSTAACIVRARELKAFTKVEELQTRSTADGRPAQTCWALQHAMRVASNHLAGTPPIIPPHRMTEWLPSVVNGWPVGSGHFNMIESPIQVNDMIEQFVGKYVTRWAGN